MRKMSPFLPQNPIIIGYAANGDPVWLDPKDYYPTFEQQQQRAESRTRGVLEGQAREMASIIIAGRERWLHERMIALAPVDVSNALLDFFMGVAALPKERGDSNKPDQSKVDPEEWKRLQDLLGRVTAWLNTEGIHCVEENKDGVFRLLLKRQGDVLSEFKWTPIKLDNEIVSKPC